MKKNKQAAFTLIELLVSATIIILLTAAGLVSFSQAAVTSRNAKRKADLETIRQALTIYKQDHAYYALTTSINFDDLVSTLYTNEYLSESALTDPKGTGQYIYQATCTLANASSNCVKVRLQAVLEPDATVYEIIAL